MLQCVDELSQPAHSETRQHVSGALVVARRFLVIDYAALQRGGDTHDGVDSVLLYQLLPGLGDMQFILRRYDQR